ncbi:hypothetical protein [Allorhodopirellula solitaria]|uniref:Prenyltransferase n=1 Tax=Allorhodopirellula solitaria TaxID=2527987 RepID=A0A5C5YFX7_9BACT|nr:hypothetical protein [Allorhodopirellula solitaria]TWT74230.1 hypothetical protein CA85_11170 [Allorhodopirellula solitaria]
MNRSSRRQRIPWLAWPSMLSLDAVLVSVVWQQLLMRGYCQRGSTWTESVSLGATVWLIYVADRLLDAARLDLGAPHTLRHAFYRQHRRFFHAVWIIVLAIDTFVVIHFLPHELLRAGVLLSSAVLIYGASVHFSHRRSDVDAGRCSNPLRRRPLPKEAQVGLLFAVGVSLSVWTEMSVAGDRGSELVSLAATTCFLAVLFGSNCVLVARFERDLDRAQSFPSIVAGDSRARDGRVPAMIPNAVASTMGLPVLLLLLPMPVSVLFTAVLSAVGLAAMALKSQPVRPQPEGPLYRATFDVRGAGVDAAVWIPPLVILLLGLF